MRAKTSSSYETEDEPGSNVRTYSVSGHVLNAPKPVPGLYLVATPIGHLGDITLRALETRAGVDIIACEDTRITRRLTERYAISAQLKPYHEHNATLARPKILERLGRGGPVGARCGDTARRPVFLRRLSAAQTDRAPGAAYRTGADRRDAGDVRIRK